jgi:hypothetical protein
MSFFLIPSDYREETHHSVVPICIADTDSEGNPIHPDWVERGVIPIADPLRRIAQRVLFDMWRVSEVTERTVHWLSRKHDGKLADEPSRQVLNHARWYAADLRAGGRRARRSADVELIPATMQSLAVQDDLVADLLARDTLQRLMEAVDLCGSPDVREMAEMMVRDCASDEFVGRFRQSRNTLSQTFYRTMRRVARDTRITW